MVVRLRVPGRRLNRLVPSRDKTRARANRGTRPKAGRVERVERLASAALPLGDEREFPPHPRVGVGGVVVHRGRVLLVRRACPPLQGEWSIPGGLVEIGETLANAVEREVKEETGLEVEALEVIGVFEGLFPQTKARQTARAVPRSMRYHYVLIDFRCALGPGRGRNPRSRARLQASSDVTEARWVRPDQLPEYGLRPETRVLILETFRRLHDGL